MDSEDLDALVSEGVDDSVGFETPDGGEQEVEVEQEAAAAEAAPVEAEAKEGENDPATPAEPEAEPDDFDPDDPAEKTPEARAGLRKALAEKTRKWRQREQELREENARLKGQAEAFQFQGKPTQEPTADVDADDEFYEQGPAAFIDSKLQAATHHQKVALSAQVMRTVHADFDEHVQEFMELVRDDPSLEARAASSDNPAKFAYDFAKMARETKEMGSPEEYRAKVRAEVEAEVKAKIRSEKAQAAAAETTTSSAGATGAGASSQVAAQSVDDWFDIDQILHG